MLGNTVVLNTNLKEFWFGWRTKKLFPAKEDLTAYLIGQNKPMAFKQLSEEQEIRFWLYGRVKGEVAALSIYDSATDSHADTEIRFSAEDHLVGFRKAFIRQLSGYGIPFPEDMQPKALWPEKVSLESLDAIWAGTGIFLLLLDLYRPKGQDRYQSLLRRRSRFHRNLSWPRTCWDGPITGTRNTRQARTAFLRAVLENAAGYGRHVGTHVVRHIHAEQGRSALLGIAGSRGSQPGCGQGAAENHQALEKIQRLNLPGLMSKPGKFKL